MRRAAVIVAVAVTFTLGSTSCGGTDCATYKFPTREWLSAGKQIERRDDEDAVKVRRQAADNLVRCRLLQGKTKRQVRAILGGPSITSREEHSWSYLVGPERGFISLDDENLTVFFRGDRVAKVVVS